MAAHNPQPKAQKGSSFLKEAVLNTLAENSSGLNNAQIADILDIRSDYKGLKKDYLSWTIPGLFLNEGKIVREGRRYFRAEESPRDRRDGDKRPPY